MLDNYHAHRAWIQQAYPLLGQAMTVHRNTRGQPMSFTDNPSILELYMQLPKQSDTAICKCVQNGVSELMVQYALWHSGWNGRICGYVLPTSKSRNRFVQNRVDPLIQGVPEYRIRTPTGGADSANVGLKGPENLQLKQFGAGKMLFLGSNSAVDFLEFSADLLVIDELDECDPGNLSKARNRLRASPYPQLVRLGNPTLPNVGISRLFNESDGRLYHHTCSHCGERQPLDWFTNVVDKTQGGVWVAKDTSRMRSLVNNGEPDPPPQRDIRPVCRRCRDPFQREALPGLWVAERPTRHFAGYRMSRLDMLYPAQSLWALYLEWLGAQGDSAALATFYCDVLGVPYTHAGMRLTTQDLQNAMSAPDLDYFGGDHLKSEVITMGVDVGAVINVQISRATLPAEGEEEPRREVIFVGAYASFGEVQDAILRYHVDVCVIDERPEIHKASEVRDWALYNTSCTVWLARFKATPRAGKDRFGLQLDYKSRVASVDRTSVCDVAVDDIKAGVQAYPTDAMTVLAWEKQMKAPARVLNEERQRIVWDENGKADHYFFANVYDRMASELVHRSGSFSTI